MVQYESTTPSWQCVFCGIVRGDLHTPWIFWEDDDFMAFLSIFPSVEWNAVIVPKQHYGSDVLAMSDDVLQKFIIASKKVSRILFEYFDDVGRVWVIMEWTGVNHAHIKLIPMHGTWHMKQGIRKQYLSGEEVFHQQYPWYLISVDGPRMADEQISDLAKKLMNHSK
jgi:diadenosine tetraphosphate (Ap4A) HIT family hydrolase